MRPTLFNVFSYSDLLEVFTLYSLLLSFTGLSKFLGMVAIAFASSKIFRIFFKMVFGIVVLGLLHGLCFLPVWMAIFCRHHIAVIPEKQDTNNNPDTTSPA